MVVREVAPGVYVAKSAFGINVGLVETSAGAVLIDAPFIPQQAQEWRQQVEEISPHGVAYRINTDYHMGHSLGTCFLPPALTVAHETAWQHLHGLDRAALIEKAIEYAEARTPGLASQFEDVSIVLPEITVGKAMSLWCGEQEVRLLHFGGHTPSTLGVYLPTQRILFTGDLVVNGCHPYAGDTICLQWLESLERLRDMEIDFLVPGHGEPGGLELVEPVYDYLLDVRTRVKECFEEGHTRRETVERVKPLDAFPIASGDEERLRRFLRSSIERIYDEIKKASQRSRQRAR